MSNLPDIYNPQPGDRFKSETKGIATFANEEGDRYKLKTEKGNELIIWKTELSRHWKPMPALPNWLKEWRAAWGQG